ncbi:biopolymer transporter ExbD [Siphonobacter sp. BAB-5385]|uniref:Biopolymer transporter ExbD n=1 Tax=Siphonobacter curvatus TaxID=2094562 RepID=A0A2S7ILA0_9BACT|nr:MULTISPECIES: biopolymer transporter ExbD [Siphonobacter]OZI05922.1 biopolymer transporter ExbD [Siphonobacter sp. BAB-5385]PMD97065.1 biopolymer transporter ExbD [Siphonobacter sp. BAB-5405]PQA58504.1 biopolymer transporter ExbD [Siphonobacter curvatus]
MKIQRRNRHRGHIEAASLSDILFFLLIFFLMIATLASPSAMQMLLPQSSTAPSTPSQVINLSVMPNQQYNVEGQIVGAAELESALATRAEGQESPVVLVRIEKTSSVQDLVDVADVTAKVGAKLVLATSAKPTATSSK